MEKFQEARREALRSIQVADHMLTQTFPLVKDTKLLLPVLNHIYSACDSIMGSVLHYDRIFKKIPPFHDTFDSKFHIFQDKSARLNKLERFVPFVRQVKDVVDRHRESSVEFTRNNSFIICDDDFKLRTINVDFLKKMIDNSKSFYREAEKATREKEHIFNMRDADE